MILYALLWTIPWHLNFICQRFRTLCLFHLHRWIGRPICLWRWNRQCSEMSVYKIQAPGNYPEESTQQSEHGESLKSRIIVIVTLFKFKFVQCGPYGNNSCLMIEWILGQFYMVCRSWDGGWFADCGMDKLLAMVRGFFSFRVFSLSVESIQPPVHWERGDISMGVMWPGHWPDHSIASSANFNSERKYTSNLYCHMPAWCVEAKFFIWFW